MFAYLVLTQSVVDMTYSEEDVLQIVKAVQDMFPTLVGCDGILQVPVTNYNKFADTCNSILNKGEDNATNKS